MNTLARHALDLEGAIDRIARRGGFVTQSLDPGAQFGIVDRTEQVLAPVKLIVADCVPLAVRRLGRVRNDRMDVQLRLVVAVDRGLLKICSDTLSVILDEKLRETAYGELHGKQISLPSSDVTQWQQALKLRSVHLGF